MKKLFLTITIIFLFIPGINAQQLRRAVPVKHEGVNVGASFLLPVRELGDFSSVGVSFDINYLYGFSPQLKAGIASGYGIVFGKDVDRWQASIKGENFQYIPIAVAGRYAPTEQIEFGADLGYAIALTDSFKDGFYYKPIIAFNINNLTQINFSYTGVHNTNSWVTWSTLNLGIMFNVL